MGRITLNFCHVSRRRFQPIGFGAIKFSKQVLKPFGHAVVNLERWQGPQKTGRSDRAELPHDFVGQSIPPIMSVAGHCLPSLVSMRKLLPRQNGSGFVQAAQASCVNTVKFDLTFSSCRSSDPIPIPRCSCSEPAMPPNPAFPLDFWPSNIDMRHNFQHCRDY